MNFIDLGQQYKRIKNEVDSAIEDVINKTSFIQGTQVKQLEKELASYVGLECITCANGTDALYVALRSLNIRSGDEVIIPSFTWVSTAGVIKLLNAKPVFVDINPKTFNIDPKKIEEKITNKTKVIMPVSIFGRSCDILEICDIAKKYNLKVVEDSAQGFGSKYKDHISCSVADISTTSFFPAKPLGCYGDGGAIFAKESSLAEKINAITKHGQKGRYNYIDVGMNSRLDTLQAAILLEKLKIYEDDVVKRNEVAKRYNENLGLADIICPEIPSEENRSVWAQYTIILDKRFQEQRENIMSILSNKKVPTALYYPAPLHLQKPFFEKNPLPITEDLSKRVLSLPMHPYLNTEDIDFISEQLIETLKEF